MINLHAKTSSNFSFTNLYNVWHKLYKNIMIAITPDVIVPHFKGKKKQQWFNRILTFINKLLLTVELWLLWLNSRNMFCIFSCILLKIYEMCSYISRYKTLLGIYFQIEEKLKKINSFRICKHLLVFHSK